MKRGALFMMFVLLAVVCNPVLANDARAADGRSSSATTLTYVGSAQSVQVVGEWDWQSPLEMSNNSGVWSVDVELDEGLYLSLIHI